MESSWQVAAPYIDYFAEMNEAALREVCLYATVHHGSAFEMPSDGQQSAAPGYHGDIMRLGVLR